MADAKISALPASTTPLAGSEILPIVQSGVTKKVSVADLTAGRATSVSTLGVGTASPVAALSNTNATYAGGTAADGLLWRTLQNDWGVVLVASPAAGAGYALRTHTNDATSSSYPLAVSSGAGSGTFKFSVQGDGTTTVTGGNLVIGTAGKGIDTSAAQPVTFNINSSEAVRIHASKGVSIGNTVDPGVNNLSVTGSVTAATIKSQVINTGVVAASGTVDIFKTGSYATYFTGILTIVAQNGSPRTQTYMVSLVGHGTTSGVLTPLSTDQYNSTSSVFTLSESTLDGVNTLTITNTSAITVDNYEVTLIVMSGTAFLA